MDDIERRLMLEHRTHQTAYNDDRRRKALFKEAADEIHDLRAALKDIAGSGPVDEDGNEDAYAGWSWCYDRASAALPTESSNDPN